LFSRYDIVDLTASGFAELHRRAAPRSYAMTPLSRSIHGFGEAIAVPPVDTGAVWVKIKLTPTPLGRLGTALLRTPEVDLKFTSFGTTLVRRLIPGMAEAGFVLSPYADDVGDFILLAERPTDLPVVTVFSVEMTQAHARNWFQPDIQVTFEKLDVPRQDFSSKPALEARANLAEMARTNTDHFALLSFFQRPDGTSALVSHRPTHMQLRVPPEKRRLHFSYGIEQETWNETGGVAYRISVIDRNGGARMLWHRNLSPMTQPSDRGQFDGEITLPDSGVSHVLFETLPSTSPKYDCIYWSDVRFE